MKPYKKLRYVLTVLCTLCLVFAASLTVSSVTAVENASASTYRFNSVGDGSKVAISKDLAKDGSINVGLSTVVASETTQDGVYETNGVIAYDTPFSLKNVGEFIYLDFSVTQFDADDELWFAFANKDENGGIKKEGIALKIFCDTPHEETKGDIYFYTYVYSADTLTQSGMFATKYQLNGSGDTAFLERDFHVQIWQDTQYGIIAKLYSDNNTVEAGGAGLTQSLSSTLPSFDLSQCYFMLAGGYKQGKSTTSTTASVDLHITSVNGNTNLYTAGFESISENGAVTITYDANNEMDVVMTTAKPTTENAPDYKDAAIVYNTSLSVNRGINMRLRIDQFNEKGELWIAFMANREDRVHDNGGDGFGVKLWHNADNGLIYFDSYLYTSEGAIFTEPHSTKYTYSEIIGKEILIRAWNISGYGLAIKMYADENYS